MTHCVAMVALLPWSGTKPAISPMYAYSIIFLLCWLNREKKKSEGNSIFIGGFNTVKILHILGIFGCMLKFSFNDK